MIPLRSYVHLNNAKLETFGILQSSATCVAATPVHECVFLFALLAVPDPLRNIVGLWILVVSIIIVIIIIITRTSEDAPQDTWTPAKSVCTYTSRA